MDPFAESGAPMVLRSKFLRFFYGPMASALGAMILGGAVYEELDLTDATSAVIGVVAFVVFVARWWSMYLYIDDKTIRIKNFWRTYEFAWSDVDALDTSSGKLLELPKYTSLLAFDLRHGGTVVATSSIFVGDRHDRARMHNRLLARAPSTAKVLVSQMPNGQWVRTGG